MLSGHESGTFEITNEILKQLWVVAWGKLYRRQTLLDLGMKFPEGYIYEDEYFHHVLLPHLKKSSSVTAVPIITASGTIRL